MLQLTNETTGELEIFRNQTQQVMAMSVFSTDRPDAG